MSVREIGGLSVLVVDADGPKLVRERDATDLLPLAWEARAALVAVPAARMTPDFWALSTGLLGAVVQKFVNYGVRLAFVGNLSAELAGSRALTDYIREANRGTTTWFVADLAELEARLAG